MEKNVTCTKKNKLITQIELKSKLHYDPETGKFTRLTGTVFGLKIGDEAGCVGIDRGGRKSVVIGIKRNVYYAHRLAWLYVYGSSPDDEIDHINGDSCDNRLINLRCVSRLENAKNIRLSKRNKSGLCGVFWRKSVGKFVAVIDAHGKKKHLGYFDNIFDAACARKAEEKTYGYHFNHGKERCL